MKTQLAILLAVSLAMYSCQGTSAEKPNYLTVDGIRFGLPTDSFPPAHLSLNKYMLGPLYPYAIDNYSMRSMVPSEAIDLRNFDQSFIRGKFENRAILYPKSTAGVISEMNVLLCASYRTNVPLFSGSGIKQQVITLSNNAVRKDVVDQVIRKYKSKYGEPERSNPIYNNFEAIEKGTIRQYHAYQDEPGNTVKANILVWKTPDVMIIFNTGYPTQSYYDKYEGYVIISGRGREKRYNPDIVECVAYPYIKYKLISSNMDLIIPEQDNSF
ncbi:hypothetical protein GYB22_12690 [bacterium]|nr:hypothetical protein [bacterium]